MRKVLSVFLIAVIAVLTLSLSACDKADKNYGVEDNTQQETKETQENTIVDVTGKEIMSSDRVMSQYFDISLFDEENYSQIYLGKKFRIKAFLCGEELQVPIKCDKLFQNGWSFSEGNTYDENSLVFAYETIETVIEKNGFKITAVFYNSSRSSQKLSDCYIVKFVINNDFYTSPDAYHSFDVNGITNNFAITDIIDNLGTPSHFYKVSDTSYYLDYFITKKDRRNGITVFINPIDDNITSIEFSFYK